MGTSAIGFLIWTFSQFRYGKFELCLCQIYRVMQSTPTTLGGLIHLAQNVHKYKIRENVVMSIRLFLGDAFEIKKCLSEILATFCHLIPSTDKCSKNEMCLLITTNFSFSCPYLSPLLPNDCIVLSNICQLLRYHMIFQAPIF